MLSGNFLHTKITSFLEQQLAIVKNERTLLQIKKLMEILKLWIRMYLNYWIFATNECEARHP